MAAAIAIPANSKKRWVLHRPALSLFFFSSLLLMQMSKGNGALDPQEESVLELLRESFNQPNWIDDPCDSKVNIGNWISCSNGSQVSHVETINLRGRNVTGTIPAEIARLRKIRDLLLATNKFEGPIPDLRNMTALVNLDLSGNALSGRIPDTSAFTNISQILLSGNNLSGDIPVSLFQHPFAVKIDLSRNSVGGPIPELSNLTNLDALDLSFNDINGTIPASINNLVGATVINFQNNPNLKGTVPSLDKLVKLGYFEVRSCSLSGPVPRLENSNSLQGIYLQYNDFNGTIPAALFQHRNLQWLHLHNNSRLSGEIPDMSQLLDLEMFTASDCDLSGPIPSLEANKKLRRLELTNNRVTSIPIDLRNLTKLEGIAVRNNRIVGSLPELPAVSTQLNNDNNYRLNDLDFTYNFFSGKIPKSWNELTELRTIKLDGNRISGQIPAEFGNFTQLQVLTVTSNNFSGPIPGELGRLTKLRTLDLRNNQFSGTVPETLVNLPNLTTLRLDNNSFTEIPDALIKKTGLYITYGNNPNLKIVNLGGTSSPNPSTGAIVGIVAGVLVATVAVFGVVIYRKSRRDVRADQLCREDMPKSARAFTLKQIKAVTENYKTFIGKGGFGSVYYGKLSDGKEVAVKVRAVHSEQGADEFLNEVRLLSRLHHRNLVPLVGYCLEGHQQILLYQYMAQNTLHDHLYRAGSSGPAIRSPEPALVYQPLDWKTRLEIAINAARGLEYLHKDCNPPVIHRDVKSSNILLTEKLQAKVADLGISKQAPEPRPESDDALSLSGVSTAIKGTFGYLDPEYLARRKLTTKSDVYSFGMVLLEIITRRKPHSQNFPGSEDSEMSLIDWVRESVSKNQVESIVDSNLKGRYNPEGVLKIAKTALLCVSQVGAERPDMGEIVHILTEALQMERQYGEIPTANETTVPFSGQLGAGNEIETQRSSSQDIRVSSSLSSEGFSHPSWNTDPR